MIFRKVTAPVLAWLSVTVAFGGNIDGLRHQGYVTYRVSMRTTIRVPSEATTAVKVWHALPTPRPWSMTGFELGAIEPSPSPDSAKLIFQQDKKSNHYLWRFEGPFSPGHTLEASTSFYVNSCDRRFNASKSKTEWSDLDGEEAVTARPVIAAVAKKLRRVRRPALYVQKACDWLDETLIYDASVPHATSDVEETLRRGRGHCGHYYQVLQSLCEAVGIPVRRVFGLNLYADEVLKAKLYPVRADYVNIHTWGEVHLPADGWIEVEPSKGKRAFSIPARYIQNNPWFQNYSVWVLNNGSWRQPRWRRREGGWDSDHGVENLITYEAMPLGTGDPRRFPRRWNSASRNHSIVAALIGSDEGSAQFATSDGRKIKVAWSDLGDEERQQASPP